MTNLNIYSKEQIDTKIPDNTSANNGDVLTKTANGNEWVAPAGGKTKHTYASFADMRDDICANKDKEIIIRHVYAITPTRVCVDICLNYLTNIPDSLSREITAMFINGDPNTDAGGNHFITRFKMFYLYINSNGTSTITQTGIDVDTTNVTVYTRDDISNNQNYAISTFEVWY